MSWPSTATPCPTRIRARFLANAESAPDSSMRSAPETSNRVVYQSKIRSLLDSDSTVRGFFEAIRGAARVLQATLAESMGPLWDSLPRVR